ncbi:hypothetical protein ACMZ8M_03405 [Gardnerella pickettii]|uniref:hypothetical protein n=1 Tax=Gardnerella pickettii TaxID=2914924 RepID=UPI0039EF02BC
MCFQRKRRRSRAVTRERCVAWLSCAQSDARRVGRARAILPLFVVDFAVLSYKKRTIHTIWNIGFALIVVTNALR